MSDSHDSMIDCIRDARISLAGGLYNYEKECERLCK